MTCDAVRSTRPALASWVAEEEEEGKGEAITPGDIRVGVEFIKAETLEHRYFPLPTLLVGPLLLDTLDIHDLLLRIPNRLRNPCQHRF